ncbi:UDP-N-acetylmuramate dehydrogenase [Helicobacter sp. 13S00477-4]|uniref:UDP-N-acetylmuramate dehydrogenase n=1 Tax=Helicobacter sp. 13S00477-4 TaxID=1905759 RepID=UPI000BA548EF|nr:UDP-N-acetylmuramate dehydrogenase [Helicobacter sp. 13S00477-4]PAF52624.1 UDP-N-acetylenolpyruvoylglucosamine reductase [Helicobacter sp. 13S00477-4]
MNKKIIDFSKYSSIKVGGEIPITIVKDFNDRKEGWRIVGYGYNLLVSPEAKDIAILDNRYDYIKDIGEFIEIGAFTSAQKIYKYFKNFNLYGLEFLGALPGSLGGLIKMNAGMKAYEIKDILECVCIDGEWRQKESLNIGYRNTNIEGIIFAARFKKKVGFREDLSPLFHKMRSSHPKKPSCGSCFKNPSGYFAGKLLESVGLKGYCIGDIGFSQEHSNFLVNLGGGKFEDALQLIELGKKRVFEEYGIQLEEEVVILE